MMTPVELHLKAYELFDAALDAGTVEAAIEALRPELEVLPREELVRLAMALTVEGALKLTPPTDRPRLAKRIGHARLTAMWAGS